LTRLKEIADSYEHCTGNGRGTTPVILGVLACSQQQTKELRVNPESTTIKSQKKKKKKKNRKKKKKKKLEKENNRSSAFQKVSKTEIELYVSPRSLSLRLGTHVP